MTRKKHVDVPQKVWVRLGQFRFIIKPGEVLTSYGEVIEELVRQYDEKEGR